MLVIVMWDVVCDVSEDVSFDLVGESFEVMVEEEEVVEEEGIFSTCDCGAVDCILVKMYVCGGFFVFLDYIWMVLLIEFEFIVEMDDENDVDDESVVGTEVDDLDDLDDVMDAFDLNIWKDDFDED